MSELCLLACLWLSLGVEQSISDNERYESVPAVQVQAGYRNAYVYGRLNQAGRYVLNGQTAGKTRGLSYGVGYRFPLWNARTSFAIESGIFNPRFQVYDATQVENVEQLLSGSSHRPCEDWQSFCIPNSFGETRAKFDQHSYELGSGFELRLVGEYRVNKYVTGYAALSTQSNKESVAGWMNNNDDRWEEVNWIRSTTLTVGVKL